MKVHEVLNSLGQLKKLDQEIFELKGKMLDIEDMIHELRNEELGTQEVQELYTRTDDMLQEYKIARKQILKKLPVNYKDYQRNFIFVVKELIKEQKLNLETVAKELNVNTQDFTFAINTGLLSQKLMNKLCEYFKINKENYSHWYA